MLKTVKLGSLNILIRQEHQEDLDSLNRYLARLYDVGFDNIDKGNLSVVDIGAGAGMYAMYIRSNYPGAVIYSFEPDPDNFNMLQLNILTNQSNNHMVYQIGVGDNSGTKLVNGKSVAVLDPRSIIKLCGPAQVLKVTEDTELFFSQLDDSVIRSFSLIVAKTTQKEFIERLVNLGFTINYNNIEQLVSAYKVRPIEPKAEEPKTEGTKRTRSKTQQGSML